VIDALADYISQLKAKGMLAHIDARIGAVHFKGLLDAGIVEPLLFGTKPEIKPLSAVGLAVDTFWRAYKPSRD
jgi:transcriptional repressor AefR-like protein